MFLVFLNSLSVGVLINFVLIEKKYHLVPLSFYSVENVHKLHLSFIQWQILPYLWRGQFVGKIPDSRLKSSSWCWGHSLTLVETAKLQTGQFLIGSICTVCKMECYCETPAPRIILWAAQVLYDTIWPSPEPPVSY